MLLRTPSGGIVDAQGDDAKRLIAGGFVPIDAPAPAVKKATTTTRKRKTASK